MCPIYRETFQAPPWDTSNPNSSVWLWFQRDRNGIRAIEISTQLQPKTSPPVCAHVRIEPYPNRLESVWESVMMYRSGGWFTSVNAFRVVRTFSDLERKHCATGCTFSDEAEPLLFLSIISCACNVRRKKRYANQYRLNRVGGSWM